MKLFQLTTFCAAALLATATTAIAAPSPASFDRSAADEAWQGTTLARETEPGDDRRGRGRRGDDGKGHRVGDELPGSQLAREAESGDDRHGGGDDGDEWERVGESAAGVQLARAERGHHGGKRRPVGKRGV